MLDQEFVRELYLSDDALNAARLECKELESWDLTKRQLCDVELLLNGAFAPLCGFLTQQDYLSVLETCRLNGGVGPAGTPWPMPVTLDVSAKFASSIEQNDRICLRDPEGVAIAIMNVQSIWEPDKVDEAEKIYGKNVTALDEVDNLLGSTGQIYLGGSIEGIASPCHYDFRNNRHTPNELRLLFKKWGWRNIVAYHTRKPMHRSEQELTLRAAKLAQANLLIHPAVGMARTDDKEHYSLVRSFQAILEAYPEQTTAMSLVQLATRTGSPRAGLWHAIIRRNFGATHFIVERESANPGELEQSQTGCADQEYHRLIDEFADELGIELLVLPTMIYVEDRAQYLPADEVSESEKTTLIDSKEVKRRLFEGLEFPAWFSLPGVIKELKSSYVPMSRQGFTIFFTGLSGSGKSTIANALMVKLMEIGTRPVTLLDGDIVRKNLSSELDFSKEHRNLNIQRIGFVASEITKNGGVAICAPIAPYEKTRRDVRRLIESHGVFIEVHIATPLDECEKRDRKGMYAKARAGLIQGFTGIDDPYERPRNPEIRLTTLDQSPDECALEILLKVNELGL